ncbi:MAG: threonine ammonia-lyase [Deltaproteobacteria bacterium]|nr:threonine ammonia-lyase [Deltaproteobacteria bacterium]
MLGLIKEAQKKIAGVITHTPLIFSSSLSRIYGFDCYLKLENLQKTGSFKVRGAYNKISSLTDKERSKGVVAASLGNHAQGVAWASSLLGVRSIIVMPETTPIVKFVATKSYGAQVIFHGKFFDEAYDHAAALSKERGMAFIPPFDDDLVMAGQGTIGLEIIAALPDVDAVIVPIGGGGLISGISSAIKEAGSNAAIFGVEAEASKSCMESLKAGRPVDVERRATLADGIAVKRVGDRTFPIIKKYVEDVVSVGEESIAASILLLLERKKLIAEGAGAAPLAAIMEGKIPKIRKGVLVLSGGNIDVTMLDRVIRAGMLKEGRIMRISTVVEDSPGFLARLAAEIADLKANILHIIHQREAMDLPVRMIGLEIILEVEGREHGEKVFRTLGEKGYSVKRYPG